MQYICFNTGIIRHYKRLSGDCNLDADIFSDAVFNELMQCHPPNAVGFQRQVSQFVYGKLTLKQTAQCFDTFAMKV